MSDLVLLIIDNLKWFINLKNKIYQFILLFEPLFNLLISFLIAYTSDRQLTAEYLLYSGLMSSFTFCLYSCSSSFLIEKWNGTLELISSTSTPLKNIILARNIAYSFVALIPLVLTFVYAFILFRVEITVINLIGSLFSILFCLTLSMASIGCIFSIILGNSKNPLELQNILVTPFILFSGVWLSNDNSSILLNLLTNLTPSKWAIASFRETVSGNSFFNTETFISIIISITFLIIYHFMMNYYEKKLKNTGSYNEY
ncbi:ABC transporter permease [Enterococcus ureasiticus]|uniref:ABC transporter permease n=1 Tax=Enterococcus ureasiticus TaxID=903984 RepID=UPI000A028697